MGMDDVLETWWMLLAYRDERCGHDGLYETEGRKRLWVELFANLCALGAWCNLYRRMQIHGRGGRMTGITGKIIFRALVGKFELASIPPSRRKTDLQTVTAVILFSN